MTLDNTKPVERKKGLWALIVGKPIEMIIGAMATIIMIQTQAIYHDGHAVAERLVMRMDAMEARVIVIEKSDATQTADIAGIFRITQYGIIPKPIIPETYKPEK